MLLVGRDDIGNFSGNATFGFGGGNGDFTGHLAAVSGSAAEIQTAISSFGNNTAVLARIYEQVGATGDANLVSSVTIPAGASPQVTALPTALPIVSGNQYFIAVYGDVSGEPAGAGESFNWATATAPTGQGIEGKNGSYSTALDPLELFFAETEAFMYWNLDDGLGGGGSPTIDTVTGTVAPGSTITVDTSNIGTITSATLGGQTLTIDSTDVDTADLTVPVDIPLQWLQSYDLVVSDGTDTATASSVALSNRANWSSIVVDTLVTDDTANESFIEAWELGVGAPAVQVGWQLQYENVTNMIVGSNTIPVIDPAPVTNPATTIAFFDPVADVRHPERAITLDVSAPVVDTTPPVISLLGDNPLTWVQDTAFVDPGWTATDNVDSSVSVTVTGSVNVAVLGSYTLNYDAQDAAGNSAIQQSRVVNVVAVPSRTTQLFGNAAHDQAYTTANVNWHAYPVGDRSLRVANGTVSPDGSGNVTLTDAAFASGDHIVVFESSDGTLLGIERLNAA